MITPRVANNFNQAKILSDELRRKMGNVRDLVDCGIGNVFGNTTRGGLWCAQKGGPERQEGLPLPEKLQ